ncbi:inorganic phosphate transporter [Indioceanicola profundi]|uniref:inorganic phosphate transporter n=1 Tax=Indioceanicola profundi TaxID=2220096 RepID=UPI00384A586A
MEQDRRGPAKGFKPGVSGFLPIGLSLGFLALVAAVAASSAGSVTGSWLIVGAAVIGGYMALNIGANDVANNMAPVVAARALTMGGALAVAAVFEAAGALLAGADVVETVSRGIINPAGIATSGIFVAVMMAALLGAALWLNLATYVGAPVSTTHSIVGGVLGAGLAAAGLEVVNWPVLAAIVASWVVSPVLGGILAALLLAVLNRLILQAQDRIAASRFWVPVVVGATAATFAAYLIQKGLSRVWKPDTILMLALVAGIFVLVAWIARMLVDRQAPLLENSKKGVGTLFAIPLIVSAAILSFAHGANDVANAIGPLAAIVSSVQGTVGEKVQVPGWIMVIGALGLSAGLALFGPRLIHMVGQQITRLTPVRAFCVAVAAAATVLAASALGLPVSSTHIAVGAIFGVGLAREYYGSRGGHLKRARREREASLSTSVAQISALPAAPGKEKRRRRKLVRRRHLLTIVTAWLVTVPLTALLSAVLFHVTRLLTGPVS